MTNTSKRIKPPYPRNVPLLKGALVSIDRDNPRSQVSVPFQYNPEELSRTLTPSAQADAKDRTRARFLRTPEQSISCTVKLEAVGDAAAGPAGIMPYLAALELFLYPKSTDLESYVKAADSGKLQVVAPLTPRILFVWGPRRVLPVQLTKFDIKETMFNDRLSPIIASVNLSMKLYSFAELKGPDFQLQLTYLKNLEKLRDRNSKTVLTSKSRKTTGAAY